MADDEIEISELEFEENLAGDLVFPVESVSNTKATSLTTLKNWLKTFFVGMTGDETIQGIKTLTSNPVISKAQPGITYKDTNMTRGSTPVSSLNYTLATWLDTNGNSMGYIQKRYGTDGYWGLGFQVTDGTNYKSLGIEIDSSGNVRTNAPTPTTGDNSTKIATTAFVKSAIALSTTPDLTNIQDNIQTALNSTDGFTAPTAGFISVETNQAGKEFYLSLVDGGLSMRVVQVREYSGDSHGREYKQMFTPIGKGQKALCNGTLQFARFIPYK